MRRNLTIVTAAAALLTAAACSGNPTETAAKAPRAPAAVCTNTNPDAPPADSTCRGGPYTQPGGG